MTRRRGFTLLEVLVALAVLAVVLLAGVRALDSLTHQAGLHEHRVAARWCVHNALVELRLRAQLPELGQRQSQCRQGQLQFDLAVAVWTTPNPNFRRVVAQAGRGQQTDAVLSAIIGAQ